MDKLSPRLGNLSWLSFERDFAALLKTSPSFLRHPVEQQRELFSLYKKQLIEDWTAQTDLIHGIMNRGKASPLVVDSGRSMISRLQIAALSPKFTGFQSALENVIGSNWQPVGNNGNVTIPELLSLFASNISTRWTHTPSMVQRRRLDLTADYGRAKGHQEPIFRELIDHYSSLLFGNSVEQVKATQNVEMLLLNSGGATFLLFLNALDHLRHQFINEDHQGEYHIWTMNSGTPYFENDFLLRQRSDFPGILMPSPRSTILTGNSNLLGANISPLPSDQKTLNWYLHKICESSGIHLIYLENIGNNIQVDIPNLKLLTEVLGKTDKRFNPGVREIFIYIDPSTMGGTYNPLAEFEAAIRNSNCSANVVIGLSAIKFLGAGTDKANLGLLYGKGNKVPALFEFMRQASYTYGEPTINTIASMPLVERDILDKRRRRFSFNAQFLASNLEGHLGRHIKVHYPGLSSHPQYELAKSLYDDFFGSFFFIELPDQRMYQLFMDKVGSYPDDIVADGTSYGLNTTRVEVRTEKENGQENPVGIRVAVGTENIRQIMFVLDRLEKITQEVLESS